MDPANIDPPPPSPAGEARRQGEGVGEGRGDRRILVGFLVYVLLLALAVFGQLTGSRAILDLFDLERYFTR